MLLEIVRAVLANHDQCVQRAKAIALDAASTDDLEFHLIGDAVDADDASHHTETLCFLADVLAHRICITATTSDNNCNDGER